MRSMNVLAALLVACVSLAGCETIGADLKAPDAGSADGSADSGSADKCPDGWTASQSKCLKKYEVGDECPDGYENAVKGLDDYGNLVCKKTETDAGSADAGSSEDAKKQNINEDNDNDGYTKQLDCDDSDASINPKAKEVCNGKDDNCDGKVDEGCAAKAIDSDGDTYTTDQKDCDDSDASVYPGAQEKCNGKDDDCDGVVDEGCGSNTSGTASVKVSYNSNITRTLNVQVWNDSDQLGSHWGSSNSSNGNSVQVNLSGINYGQACGVRLNVSVGNPAYKWLCMGHGSTATIDPSASVEIKWNGKTYNKSDLSTWSAPGGTSQGCSAVLAVGCSL